MTETADFLVELGTEELPPKALHRLELALKNSITSRLEATGLSMGNIRSFATPRRLAVIVESLQKHQPPQKIEKRGPPTRIAFDDAGAPTKAASAFAEGLGVSVDSLEKLSTDKGEWLVYRGEEAGQDASALLPEIVSASLSELPVPKRMRWGDSDVEFVRPVHWLVMLLGTDVVSAEILNIKAGNETRGHRFHAPGKIVISEPAHYEETLLSEGRVITDFMARRQKIEDLATSAAVQLGGHVILEPDVLDEVTALVEWPVTVTGQFDEAFLRLPEEVLIATLQDHQRYFPLRGEDKKLIANFISMSNLESIAPEKIQEGNERVVKPRLADAAFFWDQDRKTSLDDRFDALSTVVFQKDLGSVLAKSERVADLVAVLARHTQADEVKARRAARLAKTDLLTEMVGEFPKLQGRIGRYYAELDGEDHSVAAAIEEQYRPIQAGGELPETGLGKILSVADRLDTLAGIFSVGKKPSGNKDPFGLRRSALGLLRILIEDGIDLDLTDLIKLAVDQQPAQSSDSALAQDIYIFLMDRARRYYLDGQAPKLKAGSVTAEIFESVRACMPASPFDMHLRLLAVCQFMELEAAESLSGANKRIANILKSAAADIGHSVNPALFDVDEEMKLHEAIQAITADHEQDLKAREYGRILQRLAKLKEPVDAYFDTVLVMAEDLEKRRNRLAMLNGLRQLFLDVTDLSCIPVR